MNFKISILLFPFFLHAYHVSSSYFETDGQTLSFQGNLIISNQGLKISSDEGHLEKIHHSNKLNFAELKKNVEITLESGFSLTCDFSKIDFLNLTGELGSKESGISLKGPLIHSQKKYWLDFQCDKATLNLQESDKTNFRLSELNLIEHLECKVDGNYQILADRAKIEFGNHSTLNLPSKLEFFKVQKNIDLQFPEGHLQTDFLKLELKEKQIGLGKTQGTFDEKEQIDFSFEKMSYLEDQKKVFIEGPINIKKGQSFLLETAGALTAERVNFANLDSIKSIKIHAPFELSYLGHSIKSYHGCTIDHSKKLVSIYSENDKPSVIYKFMGYGIVADHAEIRYSQDLNEVEEVSLFGHVIVLLDEPIATIKNAMASKITFYPSQNFLKLESGVSEKILFWTEDHQLAMTAETLEFSIDPQTKKTKCKTYGVLKSIVRSIPEINF